MPIAMEGGDEERPPRGAMLVSEDRSPPAQVCGEGEEHSNADPDGDDDRLDDVLGGVGDLVVVHSDNQRGGEEHRGVSEEDRQSDAEARLDPLLCVRRSHGGPPYGSFGG